MAKSARAAAAYEDQNDLSIHWESGRRLFFSAPKTKEVDLARPAIRSGLCLDIGEVGTLPLHQVPRGYSDCQERKNGQSEVHERAHSPLQVA